MELTTGTSTTLSGLPVDLIAAMVERSCAEQGVASRMAEPSVVRLVSALLGGPVAAPRADPRSGSTRHRRGTVSGDATQA